MKLVNQKHFNLILIAFIILGCTRDQELPIVHTLEANNITHNSAIIWSDVSESGDSFVYRKGVLLSENENPSTVDIIIESTSDGIGSFQCGIADLNPNTNYCAKAFAESNIGISYGETFGFKTTDIEYFNDDRDGEQYPIIDIDGDIWFAENLRFQHPSAISIDDDINNAYKPGFLYSFEISNEVCPSGWHLPTDDDWKKLEEFIGVPANELENSLMRGTHEGGLLKIPGNKYWIRGNENATNEIGFSSYPTGIVDDEGLHHNHNEATFYWSSTSNNEGVWIRYLDSDDAGIGRKMIEPNIYCSVRCIKD